ncbi:hypothetical protein ACFFGE_13860 [Brevundimonas balnearis]|uniref:Integral membrane protein n=2 Tax=Brevundimonas balnearis TaxID=1572858 RepID=A0ABV6R5Q5_9CAUL
MTNRLSRLNDGMSALTMAAPLTGLFEIDGAVPLESYALAFLIFGLRVKFWIDDMDFFDDLGKGAERRDLRFRVGVLLALVSWTFFILAGVTVGRPPMSAGLLMAALSVSLVWIVVEQLGDKGYEVQLDWVWGTAGYLAGAALIALSPRLETAGLAATDLQRVGLMILAVTLAVEIIRADWTPTGLKPPDLAKPPKPG